MANHPKTKPQRPDSPVQPTAASCAIAVIAACLFAVVCAFCARWGWADRISIDAIALQAQLQEKANRTGNVIAATDANAVLDALLQSQRLTPGNPLTAEQLGGAYTLDVREASADGGISRQWGKAFEQYSLAVVQRPSSPYSWANRAWTKFYLGQIDNEFYRALSIAIRLGPWEPEVQFVVVDLGFALWTTMPPELQPQILAMAKNAQGRYAAQIAKIAQKRGRLAEVCAFEKMALTPACKALNPSPANPIAS